MRAIVQRVTKASVSVGDELVSSIGRGLCILVGISRDDSPKEREYLARKILNLRLFDDDNDKRWTKSVKDKQLEILCVSQFTLYSVLKGNKPDFHQAMPGEQSQAFYNEFLALLRKDYAADKVKDGKFGAYMQVQIQNDGPVTIQLESPLDATPPAPEDTAAASKEVLRQSRQEEQCNEVKSSNECSQYHLSTSGSGHFVGESGVKNVSHQVCCVCRCVPVAADGSDRATTVCGSCGQGLHQDCSVMHQCRFGTDDPGAEPSNQENSRPQDSYTSSVGSAAPSIVIQQATKLCVECSKGGAVTPCWGCKQNLHWGCRDSHVCPAVRSPARPTLSQLLQGKFSKYLHQGKGTQNLSEDVEVGNHKVKFRLERYKQKKDCCVCSYRRLGFRRRSQTVCFYCKKGLHWDCRLKHVCNMYGIEPVPPPDDGESIVVSLGGSRHGGRRDCCVCSSRKLGQRHRSRTICKFCKKGLHRKCEALHVCEWRKRIPGAAASSNGQDVNAMTDKKVQKRRGIHAGIKTVFALSRHKADQGVPPLHPFPGENRQDVAPVTSQASLAGASYQGPDCPSQGQDVPSCLPKQGGVLQEENNINSGISQEVRMECDAKTEPRVVRVKLLGNRDGRRDCIVCSSRTNGGQRKRAYTMCSVCMKGLHKRCANYHVCGLAKLHPKYNIPSVSSTVHECSAVEIRVVKKEVEMEVVEEKEKEAEIVVKEEEEEEAEEKGEEDEEGWYDASVMVPVETMTCLPNLLRCEPKMSKECIECFLYDGFKKQASLMCSICKRGVHKKCHYRHQCSRTREQVEQDTDSGNVAQVQHTGTFVGERPSVEPISFHDILDSRKNCDVCSGRAGDGKRRRSRTQCTICKKGLHLRCLAQHICPGPEYAGQSEMNSCGESAAAHVGAIPAEMERLWRHEVVVIKPREEGEEEEEEDEEDEEDDQEVKNVMKETQTVPHNGEVVPMALNVAQCGSDDLPDSSTKEDVTTTVMLNQFKDRRLKNSRLVKTGKEKTCCECSSFQKTRMACPGCAKHVHFRCEWRHHCPYSDVASDGMVGMGVPFRGEVVPIKASEIKTRKKDCAVCSDRRAGRRSRSNTKCPQCDKGLHRVCARQHICKMPRRPRNMHSEVSVVGDEDEEEEEEDVEESPGLVEVQDGVPKYCCVCSSPQSQHFTQTVCSSCERGLHPHCQVLHNCSSLVPQLPQVPRYTDTDAEADAFGDRHEAVLDGRGGGNADVIIVKDEEVEPVVQTQAPVSQDKRQDVAKEFGGGMTCICLCGDGHCEGESCVQQRLLVNGLGTSGNQDKREEARGTSHMESTSKSENVSEVATQDVVVDGEQVFLLEAEEMLPDDLEGRGGLSENGTPPRLNKTWVSQECNQRCCVNDLDELRVNLESHSIVQFKDIDVIVAKIEEELHQAEEAHDQGMEWSEIHVSAS